MNEKKSWKEIDRGRDGSRTQTPAVRRVHTPASPRGYKSDLDKMFNTGEVPDRFRDVMGGLKTASGQSAERQKLIRQARVAEAAADFEAIIRELITSYSLPEDEEILIRMLDLDDEALHTAALDILLEMDATRPLKKRALLRLRLDTVQQLARQSRTLELAQMLRERL